MSMNLPVSNLTASSVAGKGEELYTMDCDFVAPWYEPAEHLSFGRALERRRFAFLGELAGVQRALSCGEGDGRFVAALLAANPDVRVTAIDASREMRRLAEDRVARLGGNVLRRAQFFYGDIHAFKPEHAGYDLIATHFFLDCFSTSEARRVIARIANCATPHARWVVSEFHQPHGGLGHLWTGAVIRCLYAGFRVTTGLRTTRLPAYRPALASAGFRLLRQQYACGGLLVSELWQRA